MSIEWTCPTTCAHAFGDATCTRWRNDGDREHKRERERKRGKEKEGRETRAISSRSNESSTTTGHNGDDDAAGCACVRPRSLLLYTQVYTAYRGACARIRHLSRCLHPVGIRLPSRGNSRIALAYASRTHNRRATLHLIPLRCRPSDSCATTVTAASVRRSGLCVVTWRRHTVATRHRSLSLRVSKGGGDHPCPPGCRETT